LVDGGVGPLLDPADAVWIRDWWPIAAGPEVRAEIGGSRDAAWAAAVSTMDYGLAVAVDYGHVRGARPVYGTLSGYRDGRQVHPVPDGSCDLTAHVAIDSVATAGVAVAGAKPLLCRQRDALRALGVRGSRPPMSQAHADPGRYVTALAAASAAAELTDPEGLGAHWWLVQPVGGMVIPEVLSAL
jgi:SAM-dependent MidA family methyltransferase